MLSSTNSPTCRHKIVLFLEGGYFNSEHYSVISWTSAAAKQTGCLRAFLAAILCVNPSLFKKSCFFPQPSLALHFQTARNKSVVP